MNFGVYTSNWFLHFELSHWLTHSLTHSLIFIFLLLKQYQFLVWTFEKQAMASVWESEMFHTRTNLMLRLALFFFISLSSLSSLSHLLTHSLSISIYLPLSLTIIVEIRWRVNYFLSSLLSFYLTFTSSFPSSPHSFSWFIRINNHFNEASWFFHLLIWLRHKVSYVKTKVAWCTATNTLSTFLL